VLSRTPPTVPNLPAPLPSLLLGLDFSCAPSKRKPLTLARGRRAGAVVVLDGLDEWPALAQLDAFLAPAAPQDGADAADPARAARDGDPSTAAIRAPTDGFVMGCDFPFGLPRPFVDALAAHGPDALRTTLAHGLSDQQTPPVDTLIHSLYAHVVDRAGFQRLIDDWGVGWHADRPSGGKLIHRPTDAAWPSLHSTSPLQTRYVPVGKMYFEGLWRLVRADLTLPGLRQGRPRHVALEAWPGLLAAQVFGKARSYKSDTDATPERLIARMDLVDALEQGRTPWGLRLKLRPAQREHLVQDPKGDRVDAALCLLQAAWAHQQAEAGDAHWGLPAHFDPVEGWIIGSQGLQTTQGATAGA
jgi:hypothetical protein